MATDSGIGWCDHTQNFWQGCLKVSEECRFCYISGLMKRAGRDPFNGPIRTAASTWAKAFTYQRQAEREDRRLRIFTCSMSDFFHPGADEWRSEAWDVIRQCDRLDWLILTKRPQNIADRLPSDWHGGWPHVWLGVTCGKTSSLHRVDTLVTLPAAVRFISAEPLLESLRFPDEYLRCIDWIITGCEQAKRGRRRPMDIDWVRQIDAQCNHSGVAHFFKQRYLIDANGNEFGTPVDDGLLDGRRVQHFPESRLVT